MALSLTISDLTRTLQKLAEPRFRIVSKTFKGGEMTEAVIAIDGDYYAVSERTLALLRSGMSPADLDLYPVDPEDDAPEPFDGDYCHADHFGANLKSKGAA